MQAENKISFGRLSLIIQNQQAHVFWDNHYITNNVGLNIAINTAGVWTDSSKATWQITSLIDNSLVLKIVFRELPLTNIWHFKIIDNTIVWQVDMEVEEWLAIDEIRQLALIKPIFKHWVAGMHQGDFIRIGQNWKELISASNIAHLVGAYGKANDNNFLSTFFMKLTDNKDKVFPLVQVTPLALSSYVIGFNNLQFQKEFFPGSYKLSSLEILVDKNIYKYDLEIENLRRKHVRNTRKQKLHFSKKGNIKVLLANLPWQDKEKGLSGVRAGSRWPHIKDKSEGNYLPFPFFLAYATSLLRKYNINADCIDAIAEGYSDQEFIEKLNSSNYDLLVVETSVPSFNYDIELLKKISDYDIPIALCGPNVLIYDVKFMQENDFIDFILYGEYEMTLLELIQSIIKGQKEFFNISGLIWRKSNGEVVKNSPRQLIDINILPWPYRETLPMMRYWDLPGNIPYPSLQMVASRGCVFGCNFCLWPQVIYNSNHYRVRNIIDVVDEMEFWIREKGFKSVYFDDDTFNIGKKRMLQFCQEIKKRGLNKTPWAIMARADLMDKEILLEMKSAGLWAVKYGVESCSQQLVDNCHKNMNLKRSFEMIKLTKKLGIKVHLTFCFGFDGEDRDSIRKTVDLGLKLDPDSVQFSILTPFPGTKLYEQLYRQGRILTLDWSKYDGHYHCVFSPQLISPQDLIKEKDRAYRLWADYQRKKRGFLGDIKRFSEYVRKYGIKFAFQKAKSYLDYIFLERKKFLYED